MQVFNLVTRDSIEERVLRTLEQKRSLFTEILAHLAPGGWYLNYDPVVPPDAVVEEAWLRAGDRQDPTAAAKREHRTAEEQFRYENHVRYMIPLDPQLGFLRAVGFAGGGSAVVSALPRPRRSR